MAMTMAPAPRLHQRRQLCHHNNGSGCRLWMLLLFLICAATAQGDPQDDSRIPVDFQYPTAAFHTSMMDGVDSSQSQQQQQQQQQQRRHPQSQSQPRRRARNNYGQSNTYTTSSSTTTTYATLSDIWLCLACALGWTVWWVSNTRQQVDPLHEYDDPVVGMVDQQDSKRVMGHVLQISLGEDADGTGIPVYHALVDYVVDHHQNQNSNDHCGATFTDDTFHNELEEPLQVQVRKCFSTRKLLEEGFANVEVLVLTEDPTMSILFDDYLEEKMARAAQEPPGVMWVAAVHTIAISLIGTSLVGGLHALRRLPESEQVYGWISLGIGFVLLYPTAIVMYKTVTLCHRWAGPFRPGVIIHGAAGRLAGYNCTQRCGANLNPMDIMLEDPHDSMLADTHPSAPTERIRNVRIDNAPTTIELSNLKKMRPSNMETTNTGATAAAAAAYAAATIPASGTPISPKSPLYYPNAGCGFGNFNVHMPAPGINTLMGDSSVSSMSSQSQSNNNNKSSKKKKLQDSCAIDSTSSILEKYEKAMEELLAMEELALPKFEC